MTPDALKEIRLTVIEQISEQDSILIARLMQCYCALSKIGRKRARMIFELLIKDEV